MASGQSEDGDYAITCEDRQDNVASWTDEPGQISHEPRSDTYTLAFASPPPEDLLELLASVSPDSDGYHLTPLPREFLGIDSADEVMIYSPFSPYLHTVSQATDALSTFVRPRSMLSAWLSSALSTLGLDLPVHLSSRTPTPRIEVTGQGLGSVLALLTSVRLSTSHPTLPVRATLFSMPKVGNAALGHLVDTLTAQTPLRLERITNGNDPIPSLPPPHHGLHHPTSIVERHGIAHSTTERIAFGRGRIEDAYGPYESVILGVDC